MSEQGEMPPEVGKAIQREFGQQPEPERTIWNNRFNRLSDQLEQTIDKAFEREARTLQPKDDDNLAVVTGKSVAKGVHAAALTILPAIGLRHLKLLTDLGAKATGGRKPILP